LDAQSENAICIDPPQRTGTEESAATYHSVIFAASARAD
jgi:hypothetical protein